MHFGKNTTEEHLAGVTWMYVITGDVHLWCLVKMGSHCKLLIFLLELINILKEIVWDNARILLLFFLNFWVILKIGVKYMLQKTYHRHHFWVYSSVAFRTFTWLCYHHQHPSSELNFPQPKPRIPIPLAPGVTIPLSVSMNMTPLGTCNKKKHKIFFSKVGLLILASIAGFCPQLSLWRSNGDFVSLSFLLLLCFWKH